LISGGEEGVVVLWHSQGHKHDFIPRLGSPIVLCKNFSNILFVLLENNRIFLLDISSFKLINFIQGLPT
jgi:hypothetical protein